MTCPCPCIPLLSSHSQGLIFTAPQTSWIWDWPHLMGPQSQPPAQALLWEGRGQQGGTAGIWEAASLPSGEGQNGLLDTSPGAGVTHGLCPQPSLHLHHLCPPDPVPGPVGAAVTLPPGNVSLHGHPNVSRTSPTVTPTWTGRPSLSPQYEQDVPHCPPQEVTVGHRAGTGFPRSQGRDKHIQQCHRGGFGTGQNFSGQ